MVSECQVLANKDLIWEEENELKQISSLQMKRYARVIPTRTLVGSWYVSQTFIVDVVVVFIVIVEIPVEEVVLDVSSVRCAGV